MDQLDMPRSRNQEPELPPLEHRASARRKVFFSAKIVFGNGAFSMDATIKTISGNGASLTVPDGAQLPPSFYVIDVRKGEIHEAKLASSRGNTIGVNFTRTYSQNETLGPALDYLRRLRTSMVP
jgi:hypothetical protein